MRSIALLALSAALSWGCTSEVGGSATDRSGGGTAGDAGTTGGGGDPPSTSDGKPRVSGGCVITGCNDQLCSDHRVTTDCTPTAQDHCFDDAVCERGESGGCRWRPTTELHACLAAAAGMEAPDPGDSAGMRGSGSGIASDGGVDNGGSSGGSGGGGSGGGGSGAGECRQTGCFGELCADRDITGGDCRWRDEYACYFASECTERADGSCGWAETEWLDACVEIARNLGGFGGGLPGL